MFIFFRHHFDFHRHHLMNGNCYRCYKKNVSYYFRSNSYFWMMKKSGYDYKKNGFPNFLMKSCFDKLLFPLLHSFSDRTKKGYYSPYCEYCSDDYRKNFYLV